MQAELTHILTSGPAVDLTDRDTLVENLIHSYFMMVASEELLNVAVTKSTGGLQDYYKSHLEEERGHAAWLAEDLLTAGVDVTVIDPPIWCTEIVGAQYYTLNHQHPSVFLGYLAVLEGFPVAAERLAAAEIAVGHSLLRTLRYHAVNDIQHGADVWGAVESYGTPATLRNAQYVAHKVVQLSTHLENFNA